MSKPESVQEICARLNQARRIEGSALSHRMQDLATEIAENLTRQLAAMGVYTS